MMSQNFLGKIGATLLLVLSFLSFSFAEEPNFEEPFTILYDSGVSSASRLTSEELASRKDWSKLTDPEGDEILKHAFKGDVILLNNCIAVVLRSQGEGLEVYTLKKGKAFFQTHIAPSDEGSGLTPKIISKEIISNTISGVHLKVVFAFDKSLVPMSYRITPGNPGLETVGVKGSRDLVAKADVKKVVIPNYFGDDMVFSEDTLPSEKAIFLPMEKFFLSLLGNGNTIMMSLVDSTKQSCQIIYAGEGDNRQIDQVLMQTLVGKKTWVFFLQGEGIWASEKIPNWKPPFDAHWRMNQILDSGLATSESYSGKWPEAKVQNAVAYPIERNRGTDMLAFTMRDIMKNTLGVGPCEYITATEGLNSSTPHEVTDWVRKQFKRKKTKKYGAQIEGRFKEMQEHIHHSQARIEVYGQVAKDILAELNKQEQAIARLKKWAQHMLDSMAITDAELEKTDYASTYIKGIMALVGGSKADDIKNYPKTEKPSLAIQHIGDSQDRSLAQCRLAGRWLILRCEALAKQYPKSAKICNDVKDRLIKLNIQ